LIRRNITRLCLNLQPGFLFSQQTTLYFHAQKICHCGAAATIRKTSRKVIATGDIGEFTAVEVQTNCHRCDTVFRSEELRSLTPHRGKYGFDVIEYIGKALFVDCRNERDIQADLTTRKIPISVSEIAFLGKRFIVYLALAHRESEQVLKRYMVSNGGYILHMDGTCEGGSPHLFSCIDEISNIVLGNRKMPTEDSQHIIPLLKSLKAAYGDPVALVHDMGSAILKAVAVVFPGVADYICHFHFLRDLGKDLFDFEYRTIQRYTRSHQIGKALKNTLKVLKATIDDSERLSSSLESYLNNEGTTKDEENLSPQIMAYLLVAWVLEHNSASNGLGFPFDRPHLEFYLRMKAAYPVLKRLKEKGVSVLPIAKLNRTITDSSLKKLVSRMQEKIAVFDELRTAMRIASPDSHSGLNDEGDDGIKTIEARVKQFRHSAKVEKLAGSDISYQKMVKQIDKYWDKLFADPIQVNTPNGKITLQPQRTNNLMEQSFRFLKRDSRRKSGQHSLNKTLTGMLAETPLVKNLEHPEYVEILLKGKSSLAARFADIDILLVRQEEKVNAERWRKYPKRMSRLFKIPCLPQKMAKLASN
jgi:hypothetical protein